MGGEIIDARSEFCVHAGGGLRVTLAQRRGVWRWPDSVANDQWDVPGVIERYQQGFRRWGRGFGLGVCIATGSAGPASAQGADFALNRPNPSAAGDTFSAVGEPTTSEASRRATFQLTSNFAHGLVQSLGPGEAEPVFIVREQWTVHLQTRLAVPTLPRLGFLLDVPVAIVNGGTRGTVDEPKHPYGSPGGPGLGSTRLGMRLGLNTRGPVRTAAELEWGAPTARRGSYLGSDDGHYALRIHADWRRGPVRSVVSVWGRRDLPREAILGAEVGGRLGVAVVSSNWGTGVEGLAWVSPQSSASRSSTHAEVWANLSYRGAAWMARVSGGPGFALGPGTPTFRGLVSLGYHWETQAVTPLGSNRVVIERAPSVPTTPRLEWKPAPIHTAEVESGVSVVGPSPQEIAPEQPLSRQSSDEFCITESEACRELNMGGGERVALLHPVLFGTGRDVLPLEVEASLSAVVSVLNAHPELVRVAIEGHTDNVGDERGNLALSRRRAVAVLRWLVEHGVDERRLQVRAFGPRYPRFDNDVESGRAGNRRVEFTVVERSSQGRAAWHNGPAPTPASSDGNP